MNFLIFNEFEFHKKLVLAVEKRTSESEHRKYQLILFIDNSNCKAGLPSQISECFQNETKRNNRHFEIMKILQS